MDDIIGWGFQKGKFDVVLSGDILVRGQYNDTVHYLAHTVLVLTLLVKVAIFTSTPRQISIYQKPLNLY